jgi:hypothetical protein
MGTIPKIIHYCWFGRGEKPQEVKRCIDSWGKFLSDYEFMEWNEDNFSIDSAIDYVKEAYQAKKYAFVSDYVRLLALYQYGGIYFDTDIEVIQSFDQYIDNSTIVLGFESKESLLTAFIACEKNSEFIKEFLDTYQHRHFINQDGSCDLTTINFHFTKHAMKYGVESTQNKYQETATGIQVYPIEYFCGYDVINWHVSTTKNTCTVHHMASSWITGKQGMKGKIIKLIQKIVGVNNYDRLKKILKR